MKELLLILLVALATCATVEESFDDDVILEKSGISIKPTVPHITKPTKITLPKTSVPRTSPPRTSPQKLMFQEHIFQKQMSQKQMFQNWSTEKI